MTLNMTPAELAGHIAAAARATLGMLPADATPEQREVAARAIGANAAQALLGMDADIDIT